MVLLLKSNCSFVYIVNKQLIWSYSIFSGDERPNGRPPQDEDEAPGEYSPEDVKRQLSR